MTVKGKNTKTSCGWRKRNNDWSFLPAQSTTSRSSEHNYSVTHSQSITRRDRTTPLRERRWTKTGTPQRGTRRAKRR